MATRIGSLFVDLNLNIANFVSELDKSRTKSATFGVAVGTIFANVALSAARMAKDAALAFPRLIEAQIDLADQLGKTAERTGLAVESLSVLRHQASIANVDFDTLTSSIGRFNKNIFSAIEGNKPLAKTMADLGVNLAGVKAGTVSAEDALLSAVDTLAKTDNQFKKTNLGSDAFGKSFQELIPLVNEGRAGFEAARKEAERLGLVISSKTAQAAEDFNDNMTRLRATLGGVGLQVAAQVLPTFVNLTNAFVSAATEGDRVKLIGQEIGNALKGATQVALTAGLAVTGFVGALSLLAEEIQRIRLEAAKGLNAVLPKSLESDIAALQKGLDERQKRTLAIADATQTILDLMNAVDSAAANAGKSINAAGGAAGEQLSGLSANLKAASEKLGLTIKPENIEVPVTPALLKAIEDARKIKPEPIAVPITATFEPFPELDATGFFDALNRIETSTAEEKIISLTKSIAELNHELAIGQPKPFLTDEQMEQMTKLPDDLGKLPEVFGEVEEASNELGRSVSTTLTNMAQGIAAVIVEGGSMSDVFANTAKRIQTAILSTIIEGALEPLIGKLREVSSIQASGGGIFGQLLSLGASALGSLFGGGGGSASIPSLLGGGARIKTPLIGHTLEKGGPVLPHFASGGEVPAILHSGEFVMNRAATQRIGTGALTAMNKGGGLGHQTVVNYNIYNIDARGAAPGVGEEIRRALFGVEDRAVNRAVRTVQELRLRTV